VGWFFSGAFGCGVATGQ